MSLLLRRHLPLVPASRATGLALLYFCVARWSLDLAFASSNASPVWPASGLALAAMLRLGLGTAGPGIFLGALAANLAVFVGNATLAMPAALAASACIAAGNLGEAALGLLLLRRLRATAVLDSAAQVYLFAAVSLAAAALSAGVGAGTLLAFGVVPARLATTTGLTWWLGDVTGMLVVTPFLLCLPQAWPVWRRCGPAGLRRAAPSVALFAAASLLAFGWREAPGHADRLFSLAVIAAVSYAAWRHGRPGAALAVLGMAGVAIVHTVQGVGPFAKATVNDSLVSLDGFIALCTLAGLVVAASRHATAPDAGAVPDDRGVRLPALVLLGGLAITVVAWHLIAADTERRAQERFATLAEDMRDRIVERMRTYELALRGGRGLFDVSADVSREQWRAYVEALQIQQRFPGIQGLGFARHIRRDALAAHEQAMHAAGWPGYAVFPRGERAEYTSIIYLEPFDHRNRRAFGYDMFSEPVRRAAMAQARDGDIVAMSGRVTLVQEDEQEPQAGFLMYLPVFRPGLPVATPEQRRAALGGYVYAPFRVGSLMAGILERDEPGTAALELHACPDASDPHPMYTNAAAGSVIAYPHQMVQVLPVSVGGQNWALRVASTAQFEAGIDTQKAQIMLGAGTLVSLLLFSVVRALAQRREDAMALAEEMSRRRADAETRFRSLAEASGDGILVATLSGQVEFCNGAAARMLGYAPTELPGLPVRHLVPPSLRRAYDRWLRRLGRPGSGAAVVPAAHERQALRKDGSLLAVEVSVGLWEANGVRYMGAVIRDITERLAALAQLERSKADLRSLVNNTPAMVGSWDRQRCNRFCNPEYHQWFGVDPDAVRGKHMREVLGETLYALNKPFVDRALAGERVAFERMLTRPDGRTRHVQAHYIPDLRHGEVDGFFVLVFDVTPLKRAEQALQHNLKLHNVIFNHAGVGIALTRHRRFERVSREFTRLLGHADGALDGQPAQVIFPDAASYEEIGRLAIATLPAGRTLDHEQLLRRRDGSTLWCRLLARAVDPSDEGQGTIWIVQDFGERRQREEWLERARAEAEGAARLKTEFLANMSHEIRTPMNGIIGMTALTLDGELDGPQRENLLMVQDSARSLLRLLDDILDFSKMEAGKLELETTRFNLRDNLAVCVQPLALLAAEKGVDFVLDVSPQVPEHLWGDAMRLAQVVRNLCSNAVKFTAVGEVLCRVDMQVGDDGATQLCCTVSDTGSGIAAPALARLFEPFVQADSSITRRHGGTGLGLAICAQIVALMQGHIDVESEPDHGTRFRFTTRVEPASPPPALPGHQVAVLQQRRVGLLLPSACAEAALHRQLTAWGVQVQVLGATAARHPPACDAWIVDPRSPHAEVLLAQLTGNRQAPADSVVHLVAPGSAAAGPAALRPVLRKPVQAAQLAQALLRALAPRAPTPAPTSAARPPGPPEKAAVALTVLLAEDHPTNQRLAQRILEKRGHQVVLAPDGAVAVALVQERTFDVILMDVQMPVLDGLAAMERIRALEASLGRHTPMVALTAHAMKGERERMLSLGMDGYLSKPFDPRELVRLVEMLGPHAASGDAHATAAVGQA